MEYTDEQLKTIVKDVANNPAGFKFIKILLEELNAFGCGCSFNNVYQAYYNQGKRDKGIWLLDKLRESNFEKFVALHKERNKECQKQKTQE